MTLPDQLLGILVVVLSVLVVALVVAVGALSAAQRRQRRAYAVALDPSRCEDVFEALQRYVHEVERVRGDLNVVHRNTEHLRELMRDTVSRMAVVRYDAFDDMGGALSFSAALLDERGDGVVLSAINARTETRTYAKPVAGGRSEHNLSNEELRAIEAALTGTKAAVVPVGRRRGNR